MLGNDQEDYHQINIAGSDYVFLVLCLCRKFLTSQELGLSEGRNISEFQRVVPEVETEGYLSVRK